MKSLFRKKVIGKRIVITGTPEHGNLGDHAIALAEKLFLCDFFPELTQVEVTGEIFRNCKKQLKKKIRREDILVISGGGFLGDLWIREEELVRDIIRLFPYNKIIIFPQTIYFSSQGNECRELNKSIQIYKKHKNLTICLREERSYRFVGEKFPFLERKYLQPDMVLYLEKFIKKGQNLRNGAIFCLREDCESILDNEEKMLLRNTLLENGYCVKDVSTVKDYFVKGCERDEELYRLFAEFMKVEVVITDRLHGMLIAAIAGTPCIALDNKSGKVSGVYEWVKDLKYVRLIQEKNELLDALRSVLLQKNHEFSCKKDIEKNFIEFAKIIREIVYEK